VTPLVILNKTEMRTEMSATSYYEPKEPQLIIVEEKEQLLSYQETVKFLGGFVEQVKLNTGDVLLVNEDGIRLQLPINIKASAIYRSGIEPTDISKLPKILFQNVYRAGGYNILGNAVLIRKKLAHICFSDEENVNE
jgi:hypothetical protein